MLSRALRCAFRVWPSCLTAVLLALAVSPALAADPRGAIADLEEGRRAFERGAFDLAIERSTRAAEAARRAADRPRQLSALVLAAEAHQALGRYRQAGGLLQQALQLAEAAGDADGIRWVLARLGNALLATGPVEAAEASLERALELARSAGDQGLVAAVLNDLGNLLATQGKVPEAIVAYRESGTVAESLGQSMLVARARINEAAALRRSGAMAPARGRLDDALARLEAGTGSHEEAFALVGVGVGYRELRDALPEARAELQRLAARALNAATAVADRLADRRTRSYARGYLGALYEDEGRLDEALQLTRRAIFDAQQANSLESLYRWLWQAARLHRKSGRADDALAAYRRAVQAVAGIRPELAVRYGLAAVSFRESVGALFLEHVDLLLRQAGTGQASAAAGAAIGVATGGGLAAAALLVEAREVMESLKVAELRDYFRDDCVDTALSRITQLDVVSPTAAVIYPVVLPDRTELLVTLPAGLRRIVVPVPEPTLTREVRQFRRTLERRTTRQYIRHARQLYDWLIRPLEGELAAASIDTLVFVPDGALRTIPMAALHDGRQFLVARYAVAITPGLRLTDPRPLDRRNARILAVGVTEAVQGFPPLPEVEAELTRLRELFGSTTLLNEAFSLRNVENRLRTGEYTIVHVASHGEFGGDVGQTFLLAFDGRLTMDRLDQLIGLFRYRDEPLELLTLSACDTAEGDDRAALGLAGVAVKAGARSAVATLWSVNDEASADLISDFYRQLKEDPAISRAVALRRAQIRVLSDPRYGHPGFWSPFLLINNWL